MVLLGSVFRLGHGWTLCERRMERIGETYLFDGPMQLVG